MRETGMIAAGVLALLGFAPLLTGGILAAQGYMFLHNEYHKEENTRRLIVGLVYLGGGLLLFLPLLIRLIMMVFLNE